MKKITLLACLFSAVAFAQTIAISPFATGLSKVVEITHSGDLRLFAVQQTGAIKIINPNGTVNPVNFLTLTTATITTSGNEQGLLGLAFHPNYATNGYFYINYTRAGDGATVIARYSVDSTNPNIADAGSATILLTIPQPYSNHNGGTVKFGPDGYLYIGMGDGGNGGDPGNRAQNINENLGKLLRIDVDSASPYGIPADNPYASTAGNDEIWAIGLRNPWKFSFNRLNGDLWIADVGQNQIEEINKVSPTAAGLNYGWKCYEGNAVYSTCTGTATFTFPLAQYTHAATGGCSITGGYAYTGSMYPNFADKYFFADYCVNRIGMVDAAGIVTYTPNFSGSNSFTTFGEDLSGELYIASGGTIYKIIDTSLASSEFLKKGFSLYPNPTTSEFFISSEMPLKTLFINDLSGKLLLKQSLEAEGESRISTSTLQTGIYLVTVEDATGVRSTTKLTIK